MKVMLNCCPKQALSTNKSGLTLFKGDTKVENKTETKAPEVKSQPAKDTFVKSEKPAPEAKPATTAPAADPKAPAKDAKPKCEGPDCCKDCK